MFFPPHRHLILNQPSRNSPVTKWVFNPFLPLDNNQHMLFSMFVQKICIPFHRLTSCYSPLCLPSCPSPSFATPPFSSSPLPGCKTVGWPLSRCKILKRLKGNTWFSVYYSLIKRRFSRCYQEHKVMNAQKLVSLLDAFEANTSIGAW